MAVLRHLSGGNFGHIDPHRFPWKAGEPSEHSDHFRHKLLAGGNASAGTNETVNEDLVRCEGARRP